MAKYLKLFEDENTYSAFTGSSEYVTPNVSVCSGGSNSIFYNPKDYSLDYFTTVVREGGTISFNGSDSNKLNYSIDGGENWTEMTAQTVSVNVNAGVKVLWKGTCTPNSGAGIGKFTNGTATFDVEGNVMSLLFGDGFKGQTSLEGKNYAFISLFNGNTKIISAENLSLPATALSQYCYWGMFSGCNNLTSAPALPATTLANDCYYSMFSSCSSLSTAPELPATKLASNCYYTMFRSCTSLTTAPELPATALANYCYYYMFEGCTSLTKAPELPATKLALSCYAYMFQGCTSLANAPSSIGTSSTTMTSDACSYMLSNCTSLTTAPELPSTTLFSSCYANMFKGCTSLTTAPELPATTLANSCYSSMFSGCTRLNSITCLATDISATNCTNNWVNGVVATGTFTKAAGMNDWTSGVSGIPDGWTVKS